MQEKKKGIKICIILEKLNQLKIKKNSFIVLKLHLICMNVWGLEKYANLFGTSKWTRKIFQVILLYSIEIRNKDGPNALLWRTFPIYQMDWQLDQTKCPCASKLQCSVLNLSPNINKSTKIFGLVLKWMCDDCRVYFRNSFRIQFICKYAYNWSFVIAIVIVFLHTEHLVVHCRKFEP